MSLPKGTKQYQRIGEKWVFVFAKSAKKKGQCRVKHCKRAARVHVRKRKCGLRVTTDATCITCAARLYRANHPDREAYRQIRDRALRRNQIFNLTFEEFLQAIEGTEYLARRGRGIDELHLDRVKVHLGYVRGNLQVLTTAENLRKQREVDYAQPF